MRTQRGARRPNEPDIIGAKEAAVIIGTTVSNLNQIAHMPEPYDRIAATKLWRREDMEAFAVERNQRLGRYPTAADVP
jgi:hypothetical protein